MKADGTPEVGDRVGFIDGEEISLGTVRTVEPGLNVFSCIIRVTWDDGFEDTVDDGCWVWPSSDLKRVRR